MRFLSGNDRSYHLGRRGGGFGAGDGAGFHALRRIGDRQRESSGLAPHCGGHRHRGSTLCIVGSCGVTSIGINWVTKGTLNVHVFE